MIQVSHTNKSYVTQSKETGFVTQNLKKAKQLHVNHQVQIKRLEI